MRDHVASHLTDRELDHARRELTASLALSRPGSPIRAPIQAQLTAVDAELTERTCGARTPSALGLCSCGFATSDYQWMMGHLMDHPGHYEADSYGPWEPEPPR
jgi:hypothetical protein